MKNCYKPSQREAQLISIEKKYEKHMRKMGLSPFALENPWGNFIKMQAISELEVSWDEMKAFYGKQGKKEFVEAVDKIKRAIYILEVYREGQGDLRSSIKQYKKGEELVFLLEMVGRVPWRKDEDWFEIFTSRIGEKDWGDKGQRMRLKFVFETKGKRDEYLSFKDKVRESIKESRELILEDLRKYINKIRKEMEIEIAEFNKEWTG